MFTILRAYGLVQAGLFAAFSAAQAAAAPYTVEVVAARPTDRIDLQVYEIESSLGASHASVADALNKLPSISVDADGTVRVRGDSNVAILVDGKPIALLQGENRGAALNAMPANSIASVEVINHPGGEFGNEGGGGPILNLVSRLGGRSGGIASITGNVGSAGRRNGGISGSYGDGNLWIDNVLDFRHDGRGSLSTTMRERIDASTHAVSPSTQDSTSRERNDTLNFRSNARYNLGDADRLGGSLGYQRGDRDNASLAHYRDYASDGTLTNEQWRDSKSKDNSTGYSAGAFHEHKFDAVDNVLKSDFRFSSSENPSESRSTSMHVVSLSPGPDEISRQQRARSARIADLSTDYTAKFGKGFLNAGVRAVDTRQDFDSLYVSIDPESGAERINPVLTNAFSVNERVLAAYETWEYRFDERWSAKTGLRTEHTQLDIRQITSSVEAANSYTNHLPSAFVSWKLSRDTTLRFAWSRRAQRPNPNDLNPYVVFQSPTDRSSGNPQLKPSQGNSFELGFDTTWAGVKTDLRLFARNEDDVITQHQIVIKDENGRDVVLTTPQNYGENRSHGVEFVFNGKPMPALTVNISGNLRRAEQTRFSGGGLPDTISDTSLSGRTHLNYRLTAEDQLQLTVFGEGKQLWAQGYRESNWNSDFTWQRRITPQLTMLVNVNDPLNAVRTEARTESEFLRQTSVTRTDGRLFYIGFRYELGGAARSNPM